MKESSWRECIECGSARRVSPDNARARSLIETSGERIALIKEIDEKNGNFVFEDYYTSLLELLQALACRRGFKILNHICIGFYLRDELGRDDLREIFDDLRYKRNSLTYYGNRMEFETAKRAIDRCARLMDEVRRLLDN